MKYTIPRVHPSMNEYAGKNPWVYRKLKSLWRDLVCVTCVPRPKKAIRKAKIRITYYFAQNRRRDKDNYAPKLILDGLVVAGIIADDNAGMLDVDRAFAVDKEGPRTEIEVSECTN